MAAIHAMSLRRHADVEVIVGSGNLARARAFADDHGFRSGDTFTGVLASSLDGLIISTHTGLHAELLEQASIAGTPVFCEKPLTLDVDTTRSIVERYDAAGITLQVGFHRRFDPGFRNLRDAILSGSVGDLYSIVLTARDHDLPPPGYVATSGGVFRDMHIHDFDSALWLSGTEVRRVSAHGSCLTGGEIATAGDADVTSITLELDGGTLVTIVGGRRNARGYDTRAEVYGSKDALALGLGATLAARRVDQAESTGSTWDGFAARYADAYDSQIDSYIALCSGCGVNEAPAQASLDALRIAVACERAARTQTPVVIEKGSP